MEERIDYFFAEGLDSCPFCSAVGGEWTEDGFVNAQGVMIRKREYYHAISRQMETQYRVICKGCGAMGGGANNPEYAVKKWNRRGGGAA